VGGSGRRCDGEGSGPRPTGCRGACPLLQRLLQRSRSGAWATLRGGGGTQAAAGLWLVFCAGISLNVATYLGAAALHPLLWRAAAIPTRHFGWLSGGMHLSAAAAALAAPTLQRALARGQRPRGSASGRADGVAAAAATAAGSEQQQLGGAMRLLGALVVVSCVAYALMGGGATAISRHLQQQQQQQQQGEEKVSGDRVEGTQAPGWLDWGDWGAVRQCVPLLAALLLSGVRGLAWPTLGAGAWQQRALLFLSPLCCTYRV
jgi:hypothetical protein